jgi:MFS family permease
MALVTWLWIREPVRPVEANPAPRPKLLDVARFLWGKRAFRHATGATALLAFGGFGSAAWVPSFLVRSHAMPIGLVGLCLALVTLCAAAPTAMLAGRLADRLSQKDTRWQMRLPALAMLLGIPFSIIAMLLPAGHVGGVPTYLVVVALFAVPTAAAAVYIGPVLAGIQGMVPEPMRATSIAIFLFVTNLVGLGAAPAVIGLISDLLQSSLGAESLRWALLVPVLTTAWSAAHFWMAGRRLPEDLIV